MGPHQVDAILAPVQEGDAAGGAGAADGASPTSPAADSIGDPSGHAAGGKTFVWRLTQGRARLDSAHGSNGLARFTPVPGGSARPSDPSLGGLDMGGLDTLPAAALAQGAGSDGTEGESARRGVQDEQATRHLLDEAPQPRGPPLVLSARPPQLPPLLHAGEDGEGAVAGGRLGPAGPGIGPGLALRPVS